MSNGLLSKIAVRLEKIGCPACLNTRFAVILRCDLSQGDSSALVGECQLCSGKFDIQNCATVEEVRARAEKATLLGRPFLLWLLGMVPP